MKKIVAAVISLFIACSVYAQYPEIADSIVERGTKMQAEIYQKTQEAWAKALPIVQREESLGRPYRPWAAKPEDLLKNTIPAFPGAEGGGMYTAGGRGGKVLVVTNLNDSGKGSFREACETGGARTIVFNVAGIIRLQRAINIMAPYVTIVGETAPGDGVCITGSSVLIDTHDVIIRHMRFRRGATDIAFRDDALGGNPVGNIILDHCSGSWGLDENMSIYRHVYQRDTTTGQGLKLPTVNVTIQNSIFSEALDTYNHAFGATIGGYNCMFNRNLFACNISRNCSVGMNKGFNYVNNVIFNWWNRSVDGGDNSSMFNIINNYYKPGPITPLDKPISYRIIKPESGRSKESQSKFGRAYVNGNIVDGNERVTKNNWDGGVQPETPNLENALKEIKVDTPFPMPPVSIIRATEAYDYVLSHAGATLPVRDAVDQRITKTVATGVITYAPDASLYEKQKMPNRRLPADSYKKGIITDIRQVGGLPEYKGKPYVDSDNDGMPDSWEIKYKLNPQDPSDAIKDCNGDGYTNIEKFIYHIDPAKRVDWTNLKNNHDTLASQK
jgi:hypothetical protein